MTKTRLEAFSDAVIAIIMTVMVLELTVPERASWSAIQEQGSEFLTYLLSFVFLGIYWSNHHHLIHTVKKVNGKILWANLHLLFWLSLTPFVTGWMGRNDWKETPTMAYGIVLLCSAIAYYILQGLILATHPKDSPLRAALGTDLKGRMSPVLYLTAIVMAYISRWVSLGIYVLVALMWLIPDRRIESVYDELETQPE